MRACVSSHLLVIFINLRRGLGTGSGPLTPEHALPQNSVFAALSALKDLSLKLKKPGNEGARFKKVGDPLPMPKTEAKRGNKREKVVRDDAVMTPQLAMTDLTQAFASPNIVSAVSAAPAIAASKRKAIPAKLICPRDCSPGNKDDLCTCLEERALTTGCDDGFRPGLPSKKGSSGAFTTCVKDDVVPMVPICDAPGSDYVGSKCSQRQTKDAILSCPENATLKGSVCVKVEQSLPQLTCPPGYALPRKEESGLRQLSPKRSAHPLLPLIPDPTNSICQSSELGSVAPTCPDGFHLHGKGSAATCRREVYENARTDCPPGYIADEIALGVCHRKVSIHPTRVCPEGFLEVFHGTDAATEISSAQDCVQHHYQHPIVECNEGFVFDSSEKACLKVVREAPRLTCPDSQQTFDGVMCKMTLKALPLTECPPGTNLEGKTCVNSETVEGTIVCPEHAALFDPNHRLCRGIDNQPTKMACPFGTELDVQERQCLSSRRVSASLGCASPFFMSPDRTACIRELVLPTTLTCSEAYEELIGGYCVADHVTTPRSICPMGYEAVRSAEMGNNCAKQEVRPSKQICDPGFIPYGNKCIRQYSKVGYWECPNHAFLDNSDPQLCWVQ